MTIDTSKFGDSFSGGGAGRQRTFFNPEDFVNSPVLMIEVKGVRTDANNPFFEEDKPEDARNSRTRLEVDAAITSFSSPEALAAGEGKEMPSITINQTYLASDLKESKGKIEVYKLHKQPNKNPIRKASWVWRGVEGKLVEQVKAYYVKREEAIAAALEGDDTPDFLKG